MNVLLPVDPVVTAIPRPDHVYTGVPAPPEDVAVNVITPPEQKGFESVEATDDTKGCAATVTGTV